jgi:hypothetical protein
MIESMGRGWSLARRFGVGMSQATLENSQTRGLKPFRLIIGGAAALNWYQIG